jgi:hypothetical protein
MESENSGGPNREVGGWQRDESKKERKRECESWRKNSWKSRRKRRKAARRKRGRNRTGSLGRVERKEEGNTYAEDEIRRRGDHGKNRAGAAGRGITQTGLRRHSERNWEAFSIQGKWPARLPITNHGRQGRTPIGQDPGGGIWEGSERPVGIARK